jgi:hypothetical protein
MTKSSACSSHRNLKWPARIAAGRFAIDSGKLGLSEFQEISIVEWLSRSDFRRSASSAGRPGAKEAANPRGKGRHLRSRIL